MIYRSNLTCPDLAPHFKHLHSRVMPHSMGHDVPSDWADKADDDPVFGIYKRCGMWTHDEAAILYTVAAQHGGFWLDIGAHTGWTAAHIGAGGCSLEAIDPMFKLQGFQERFEQNFETWWRLLIAAWHVTSLKYFERETHSGLFDGIVIDGDHEPGKPLEDARNAAKHLRPGGVILFHDGIGKPVREAVTWLLTQGFKARIYWTPHIVFCCWRGDFEPPVHVGDPSIDWEPHLRAMEQDFDFGRLS